MADPKSAGTLFEIDASPQQRSSGSSGSASGRMRLMVYYKGDPRLEKRLSLFSEFGPRGHTTLSDAEIKVHGLAVIEAKPEYSLFSNNCQHFVTGLWKLIQDKSETPRFKGPGEAPKEPEEQLEDLKTTQPEALASAAEKIAAVNEFLKSQKFPEVEELLNIWAENAYLEDREADEKVGVAGAE